MRLSYHEVLCQMEELEGIQEDTLSQLHLTEGELTALGEEAASLEAGLGARRIELLQQEKLLKVGGKGGLRVGER